MIKGISILRATKDSAAYQRLGGFFEAMGFAKGSGWKDATSSGASFLAPLGNFEFVDGKFPPVADVMVEVTSLDAAYQAAQAWLRTNDVDEAQLSQIADTNWKSRIFTVEP